MRGNLRGGGRIKGGGDKKASTVRGVKVDEEAKTSTSKARDQSTGTQ